MEHFRPVGSDTVAGNVDFLLDHCNTETSPKWPCPVRDSTVDEWTWNPLQSSSPTKLVIVQDTTAVFHPVFSNSTSGVRGTRLLNGGLYYWEIAFGVRGAYGSAMMIGISTTSGRLESSGFDAIIGEDQHSWGLSHKGYLHHNGQKTPYCSPFEEMVPTVVGVVFDGLAGTLTFYKEGQCLGLAFTDLQHVKQELYPMISSTAAKTAMRVQNMRRGFLSLQDRCRDAILRSISKPEDMGELAHRVPLSLRRYVSQHLWKVRRLRG